MFYRFRNNFNSIYPMAIYLFLLLYLAVSPINRILPLSPNRILVIIFFLLIAFRAVLNSLKNILLYVFVGFLVFVFFYSSYNAGKVHFVENLEDFIYFAMTLSCFVVLADTPLLKNLKVIFIKYKVITLLFVVLTAILFALSLLFKSSYETGGAFRGFTVISHSVATVSIFAMTIMIASHIVLPIWYLPFVLFIYLSQARTFLLLLIPIILFYCLMLFKKKRYSLVLFFGAVALVAVIVPFTPLWAKITNLHDGTWFRHHPIDAISSTRSLMWTDCLRVFFESSATKKFFGGGFSYVRDIISADLTGRVWAHNDLIETLLSTGVFGLLVFFATLGYGLSKQTNGGRIAILSVYIISALFNGFILYFPLSLAIIVLGSLYSADYQPSRELMEAANNA